MATKIFLAVATVTLLASAINVRKFEEGAKMKTRLHFTSKSNQSNQPVASNPAGADLNLLQVGLSMQSEKMEKEKATSIFDLAPARRLSLLAQADEMLNKDLPQHRAKMQQWLAWQANRTKLIRGGRATATVSNTYATMVSSEISKYGTASGWSVVQSELALGIAMTLKTLMQTGDWAAVSQMAASQAATVVSGVADMAHPLLGLAVTMVSTVLSGLVPGSDAQGDAMTALYKAVMDAVKSMISGAILSAKLSTVKGKVISILQELQWVPDLVYQLASSEVKLSYLLTVQHDLATNARAVFGDCFNNRNSNDCKDWEEAGTIDVALKFAELHLSVLIELYAEGHKKAAALLETSAGRRRRRRKSSSSSSTSSSPDGFQLMLAEKAYSLTKKYKCLLDHSWTNFVLKRERDLEWRTKDEGVCKARAQRRNSRRRKQPLKCCNYHYQVRDPVSGTITESRSNGYYSPPCNYNQDATWNAAKQKIRTDAESKYLTNIQLLTIDVLSTADFNNPCR